VEKREKTESRAVNFMVEEVGARYCELYNHREEIEAKLDKSHEVSCRAYIVDVRICSSLYISMSLYKFYIHCFSICK